MANTRKNNNPRKNIRVSDLPARITEAGSKQTYYTFRLLADRGRVEDALRSYAYYRWLDDLLDCNSATREEKLALLTRQQTLLDRCYRRQPPGDVGPEEQMLVDLIHNDNEEQSGLQIYLRNMMAVMSFDVERCGRLISEAELSEYTRLLSTAVTDLLFYFIGHEESPSRIDARYYAVKGAHVIHMLRDMVEDISAGYFNVPAEYIKAKQISLDDLHNLSFRKWVFERVKLARQCFEDGRKYISQVNNFRCRLAGLAYLTRFEWVLRAIEKDGYCLRAEYPERKSLRAGLWMSWRTFSSVLNLPWIRLHSDKQLAFSDICEE